MADENGKSDSSTSNNGYMVGIAIGMTLGSVFGLLIFDNLALGYGMGLPIGIAIGMMGQSRRKTPQSPADET